jgi:hypothetical protein
VALAVVLAALVLLPPLDEPHAASGIASASSSAATAAPRPRERANELVMESPLSWNL